MPTTCVWTPDIKIDDSSNLIRYEVKINPNDFKILLKPGVYIFWLEKSKRNRVALYIGSGRRTLSRMTNPRHEKAQRALQESTLIELISCINEPDARTLEQTLISIHKPLYNVQVRKNNSEPMSWRR